MGALVTLDLPDESPVLTLPWIITFGPLDDSDEWEPVVCGPYERAHALALAETVVADEELMAVVEPVLPHASVEEIRNEIESARAAAAEEAEFEEEFEELGDEEMDVAVDEEYEEIEVEDTELEEVEPTPPPSPEEIRAGFARIAAKLAAGG